MQTTTKKLDSKGRVLTQLLALGFHAGAPPAVDLASLGADCAVGAELPCLDCGHPGLAFLPLSAGRNYCGVLVCPSCGFQVEV